MHASIMVRLYVYIIAPYCNVLRIYQEGKVSHDNSAQQCAYKAAARHLSYVCWYRCMCWFVRFVLPLLVLAVMPLSVALAVLLSLFRPQLCLKLAEALHFAVGSLHGNT